MNKFERKRQLAGFKKTSSRFYFAYKHKGTGEVVLLKGPTLEYVQDLAEHYEKKTALVDDVYVLGHEFEPVGKASQRELNSAAMAMVKRDRPEWFSE